MLALCIKEKYLCRILETMRKIRINGVQTDRIIDSNLIGGTNEKLWGSRITELGYMKPRGRFGWRFVSRMYLVIFKDDATCTCVLLFLQSNFLTQVQRQTDQLMFKTIKGMVDVKETFDPQK